MAAVIPLPARAAESKGLLYWMERVLRERERVLAAPEEEAVHDLRVALRRCRSLARVFEEIDPHPAWRGLRKTSRKLFRGLGGIRDSHVQESWIVKLAAPDDPLRAQLLYTLKAGRERQDHDAKRSASRFDEKAWAKLAVALRPRLKLLAADGPAAHCLALERLEEAAELHRRALRTERPKPWHALRIGIKHFRYVVENLLPKRHVSWAADLKRVQDLLGDVHDLDVLLETVRRTADSSGLAHWQETIDRERAERIATYRQLTLGATSLWNQWRLAKIRRRRTPRENNLRAIAARRRFALFERAENGNRPPRHGNASRHRAGKCPRQRAQRCANISVGVTRAARLERRAMAIAGVRDSFSPWRSAFRRERALRATRTAATGKIALRRRNSAYRSRASQSGS